MIKLLKTLLAVVAVAVLLLGVAKVALALSGTYVYANGGSYYTRYGPSERWNTTNGVGSTPRRKVHRILLPIMGLLPITLQSTKTRTMTSG